MSQKIIDLLNKAVEANQADKFRNGNLICLPSKGNLIVAGDLHGHRRNFERIISYADLAKNPQTHLLLQEIIHGGPRGKMGGCMSFEMLFDAVRLKLKFPDRVHLIIGNHDTAFISDGKVMKNGEEMNHLMNLALKRCFGTDCEHIKLAIKKLLLSQPLALRTESRIWVSHSLPNDRWADKFDCSILEKKIDADDMKKYEPVYLMTWGRKHTCDAINKWRRLLDVDVFILGHQTRQQGWSLEHGNLIIITSEHNHGCLLPIDLALTKTAEQLIKAIVPLASIE